VFIGFAISYLGLLGTIGTIFYLLYYIIFYSLVLACWVSLAAITQLLEVDFKGKNRASNKDLVAIAIYID
jgi:hypothetical protein